MGHLGRSLESITERRKNIREKISLIKKEISEIESSKNFKLSKIDQEHYDSWNKAIEENKKGEASIFNPYKNEIDYAINWKQGQIKLYKNSLVKLICEEKGHKEVSSHIASGSHTGTRVYANCGRCGMGYTRGLTSEESENFYKFMHTPMTI